MSIRTTEDRFRELGLKPPDLSFMNRLESPGDRNFNRENLYNTRVLVDNWYEDRRQYKSLCSRCTGDTIYKTDYEAPCPIPKDVPFPPRAYQYRLDQEGEGMNFLRNTEDYCPYLQNYTTTYDLMHNWEVRRAGLKPRPWRLWKMVADSTWYPQSDNALPFGNLTQLGYRKAPQVPLLPNDWDLYGGNQSQTEYRFSFPQRRYPEDYVHCRKVPTREVSQEIHRLALVRKPKDPCDPCGECTLYQGGRSSDCPCGCLCHQVDRRLFKRGGGVCSTGARYAGPLNNTSRFGTHMPMTMTREYPGKQTLHLPKQPFPYKALKHPPHLPPVPCQPCEPRFEERRQGPLGQVPDGCRDYAGDVLHDYKGPLQEAPLCECFIRK